MDKTSKKPPDYYLLTLVLVGVALFFLYSYLALTIRGDWQTEPKLIFNSPDETANYFFSDLMARESKLQYFDPANLAAAPLISPRSMRVIDVQTVPAGFIGLPLIYGLLAKILSSAAIPFFTPALAVIGVIFFYFVVKELFGRQTGFLSAGLLLIFPGFWYYAIKGLMPNVAFVVLLIMAGCFFARLLNHKKLVNYLLFGFVLGLALMIRTSEIVWIGFVIISLTAFHYRKIKFNYLVLSVLLFFLVFSPIFFFNQQIYGSPLSYGYSLNLELAGKNVINQGLTLAEKIILPFGFHPRLAWKNLFDYTYGIFPLWTLLFLASFVTFIRGFLKYPGKFKAFYLILFLLTAAYVVIYYGSWQFHDNPDPNAVTIGTSYIRYWLPLYIFVLPLLARALIFWLKNLPRIKTVVLVYFFAVLSLTSYQTVFWGPEEGVLKVKENINGYQQIASQVFSLVPEKSVIIAGTMDKVFFPARSVIVALNNPQDYVKLKKLLYQGYAVYYFYFSRTPAELAEFNQRYFQSYGLRVESSLIDFEEQSLYPVVATVDS